MKTLFPTVMMGMLLCASTASGETLEHCPPRTHWNNDLKRCDRNIILGKGDVFYCPAGQVMLVDGKEQTGSVEFAGRWYSCMPKGKELHKCRPGEALDQARGICFRPPNRD